MSIRTSTFVKTECLAGITTFLTMVYIAFVNPAILHDAGMNAGSVFTATCLVTAAACFLNGFIANTPLGVAPGMALNIYFAYSVVQGNGVPWQQGLAMVCIASIIFLIVSVTPLRKLLIDAIPHNLQIAILIGISLLIALIALENNHIIVSDPHTLMHLGNMTDPSSILFFLGFILIVILDYYQVRAAIIIGILSITVLSILFELSKWHGFWALPPSIHPTFLALDFHGLYTISSLKIIFTFFLIAIFDATGTLIGLLSQSDTKQTSTYRKQCALSLSADAGASIIASLLGCASTSPFIESATGIRAGGRTGLTAYVIGIGFICTLFLFPLAETIPNYAVGPALLYVACCMVRHITYFDFQDMTEVAPCMITMIMIPFTFSIADGIGTGIILYVFIKWLTRQKVSPLMVALGCCFIGFFLLQV